MKYESTTLAEIGDFQKSKREIVYIRLVEIANELKVDSRIFVPKKFDENFYIPTKKGILLNLANTAELIKNLQSAITAAEAHAPAPMPQADDHTDCTGCPKPCV